MQQTLTMPSQARCLRVPPTSSEDTTTWGSLPVEFRPVDELPIDPRSWSRAHVSRWVARGGGLPDRFPMNGKALCLMSEDMFSARVPGKGGRLYQDFRTRLSRALALQDLVEKLQNATKK